MKFLVENLGPLKKAEFELGDLTIICGDNNTGKTYATYAVFGFLTQWKSVFSIEVPQVKIEQLLKEGVTKLDLQEYVGRAQEIVNEGCKSYTKNLPVIFASSQKYFSDCVFQVHLDVDDIQPISSFERKISAAKSQLFIISKEQNKSEITISLLLEKEDIQIPSHIIDRVIGEALKDIIFDQVFPNPFIASAERTGAAIFRKDLNFARNRLLEQVGSADKDVDPFNYFEKVYSDYALPVKRNVDFTRQLEDISKQDSFVSINYPELLDDFSDIIGGNYTVTRNDELYYVPKSNKNLKLTMDESSSSVRSLLDIGFYLRHVAQPGDILMVDEPELNLHPENQRRVARLFSRLINMGIKVFLTTHSDYMIKELNTLIMFNQNKPYLKKLALEEGYSPEEFLSADRIRVLIAEKRLLLLEGYKKRTWQQTLVPATITQQFGIEARSFDTTIDEMNRIHEAIVWGDE